MSGSQALLVSHMSEALWAVAIILLARGTVGVGGKRWGGLLSKCGYFLGVLILLHAALSLPVCRRLMSMICSYEDMYSVDRAVVPLAFPLFWGMVGRILRHERKAVLVFVTVTLGVLDAICAVVVGELGSFTLSWVVVSVVLLGFVAHVAVWLACLRHIHHVIRLRSAFEGPYD